LAELEFWKERYTVLTAINEQLQSKEARVPIQVLNAAGSDVVPGFEFQQQELASNLLEARDISRFLMAVERHLKTLTLSDNYSVMIDSLPQIMEGLQLVWTLSRHYNKDYRMCGLLEMIAKLLYDRTTSVLHPATFFKM
jgi:dynein heavy chain